MSDLNPLHGLNTITIIAWCCICVRVRNEITFLPLPIPSAPSPPPSSSSSSYFPYLFSIFFIELWLSIAYKWSSPNCQTNISKSPHINLLGQYILGGICKHTCIISRPTVREGKQSSRALIVQLEISRNTTLFFPAIKKLKCYEISLYVLWDSSANSSAARILFAGSLSYFN